MDLPAVRTHKIVIERLVVLFKPETTRAIRLFYSVQTQVAVVGCSLRMARGQLPLRVRDHGYQTSRHQLS